VVAQNLICPRRRTGVPMTRMSVWLAVVLFGCMACQHEQRGGENAGSSKTNEAESARERPNAAVGEQQTTERASTVMISGRVLSVSDVAGMPERPFRSGHVLLIPADEMEALLDEAPRAMDAAAGASFGPDAPLLDRALFEQYVAVWGEIKPDGTYAIDVNAGAYMLALTGRIDVPGESSERERIDNETVSEAGLVLPTVLIGWSEVSLPSETAHTIDLLYDGEARQVRAERRP